MIWFMLAMLVISFLVTAFLMPKPEIEDARAQTLDNLNFPRATEDAPYPLVLGKVLMKGPNTLWYGDFVTKPIKEKIKTGLFSSTKVIVGYEYFLGYDMGLCMGPGVTLHDIIIDEENAWTGTVSASGSAVTLNKPNHFGGYKEGGGIIGTARWYSGEDSETVNTYIEGIVGAGGVPAYNGLSRLVFEGINIGEAAQLRKTAFVISSYTNTLNIVGGAGKVNTHDINPMEALYQIMTDDWRGLGIAIGDINTANFLAAAEVLFTEGNGVSVQVTTAQQGKKVIEEILRQIDAIMFQDPATGQFTIKLIRDDYDVGTLPLYDEDDVIKVRNFTKTAWDDVVAQVKVSFPQRDRESNAVAVSQDMATAGMIGRLKSVSMSFPFCYDKDLANRLASRERAQQSVPLFRMTLEMNRSGYTLRPGSVFKMSWPDYNLVNIVMRVKQHNIGELLNNKVVIDCVQDSFALDTLVFAPPTDSGWVDPITAPQIIATKDIIEMPRFYQNKLEHPIADGFAGVIPIAIAPSNASTTFDLISGVVTGVLDVNEPTEVEYPATGLFTAAFPESDGWNNGVSAAGLTLGTIGGTLVGAGTLAIMREGELGMLYANGEWMAFLGVTDNLDTTFTLTNVYRGLFGTQPTDHAINDRAYVIVPDLMGMGTLDNLGELAVLYYKMLDRVGPLRYYIGDATQATKTMLDIADRPLRARYVALDADRTFNKEIPFTDSRDVSWRASNREVALVTIENDAAETPDQTEHYDVILKNGVATVAEFLAVTTPHTVDFGLYNETGAGEILIRSSRTGGDVKDAVEFGRLPIVWVQSIGLQFEDLWDTFNDITSANIEGLYGLRRRVSGYTGPLIRVRDTNDDSEQDVGQNEVGALADFTVVGSARVVKMYDQSGNALDLVAPADAQEPLIAAHPLDSSRYSIDFDATTRLLRGPTFNSGAPNAHAMSRPNMWFSMYHEGPLAANEYIWTWTHNVNETPTLVPFWHTGVIDEFSGATARAHWNETDLAAASDDRDATIPVDFRAPFFFGPKDASTLAARTVAPAANSPYVTQIAIDRLNSATSETLDWTGAESKALELGGRTDKTVGTNRHAFEAAVYEGNMFSTPVLDMMTRSMMREMLSREIIRVNDVTPSTTEWAQGGAYGATLLNPDREVSVAYWRETNDITADISFQCYDIDTATEVGVYLNGERLGYANTGANETWHATQTFSNVSSKQGWNIITFRQEDTVTFIWGVRNITVVSDVDPVKRIWASFEGADAATAYTERSHKRTALTFFGTAQLDTAQSKFGASSLLLDGNSDHVELADHADYEIGTADFTLEAQIRFNTLPGVGTTGTIFSKWDNSTTSESYALDVWNDGGTYYLRFLWTTDGFTATTITRVISTPSTGVWYHVAVDRDGTTGRMYFDEAPIGATFTVAGTIYNAAQPVMIGSLDLSGTPGSFFDGHIDEVKLYIGKALYKGTCVANGSEA